MNRVQTTMLDHETRNLVEPGSQADFALPQWDLLKEAPIIKEASIIGRPNGR